jgi:hypothetical protein
MCLFFIEYLNSANRCGPFASDRIEGLKCHTCELNSNINTSARWRAQEREILTESGNYNHDVKYLVRLKHQIKAARGKALGKARGVEGGAEDVD